MRTLTRCRSKPVLTILPSFLLSRCRILVPGGSSLRVFGLCVLCLAAAGASAAPSLTADKLSEARRLYKESFNTSAKGAKGDLLSKALVSAREVLRLSREEEDSKKQVQALIEIGKIETETKETQEAQGSFDAALKLAGQIGDREEEAYALRGLGALEFSLKDPKAGLDHFARAVRIWEELGLEEQWRNDLYNLAATHYRLGNLDQALLDYKKVLPLVRGQGNRSFEAEVLNSMALTYSELGDVDQAFELFGEVRKICDAQKAGCDDSTRNSYLDCAANLFRRTGDLQKALSLILQAQDLSRNIGNQTMIANNYNYLTAVYRELGSLDDAAQSARKALDLHKKDLGRQADTLGDLGWIALEQQDPRGALQNFEKALALLDSQKSEAKRSRAGILQGIGAAHRDLRELAAALQPLETAFQLRQGIGDRLGQASVLIELGQVRQALGKTDEAAADFQRALALSEEIRAYTIQSEALYRLARLSRDEGGLPEARERIASALEILERVRKDVAIPLLRSTFLAQRREYQELQIDVLMRLDDRAGAFQASERAHARGLLDLLAEGRLQFEQKVDPEIQAQEAAIGDRLTRTQRLLLRELSKDERDELRLAALREELDQIEQDRRALEVRIREKDPRYARVRYPDPLVPGQVQALLDDKTVLLEYFLGQESSYLFAVTRDGLQAYRLPPAAEIDKKMRKVREGMEERTPSRFAGYKAAAFPLYQDLIGRPLGTSLAGKRLLIAADEDLHLLAFEALLTAEPGQRGPADLPYLLRNHAVAYVPSASVLADLRAPRGEPAAPVGPERKLFVAFADPIVPGEMEGQVAAALPEGTRGSLDRGSRLRMAPLPGTGEEVDRIASLYLPGEVKVYRRAEATEGNVKNNPLVAGARRIQFATHGIADEEEPDLASLVLTDDAGADDGLLQVHEIFNLKLSADLVVLSACETGLGKKVSGEGLIGLSQAFFYAGAPSVVASLWPVSDQTSTPDLMVRFYRELDGGADKAEALRRARLAAIAEGHAHPYFWAPFVLLGDPDPARR
ncbi:MAG TPA: CHAT domain-containing protein [Thermoanaerobaculia bacterium]|nr:CHAT domain-containing protein [Thermoanaerobaculia bacterium]